MNASTNLCRSRIWLVPVFAAALLVIRAAPERASAQSFAEVLTPFPALALGSVAWGDYDNDGDLDALMTGQNPDGALVTKIFRNDGGGTFRMPMSRYPGRSMAPRSGAITIRMAASTFS
jgi:hypothetical protein